MRNTSIKHVFSFICLYFCFVAAASSQGIQWADVSDGIREGSLQSVAVEPGNPDTVFVSSAGAVYKTLNGGRTWNEILSFRGSGNTIHVVYVPFSKQLTVYTGTKDGLFRSNDGGSSWKRVFSGVGPDQNSVLSLAVHPEGPGRIVIGTEAGLFISEDDADSWTQGQNLPADTAITFIAIDRSNPYIMYAAAERGVYKSLNGGNGWRKILDTNTASDDEDALSAGEEEGDDENEGMRTITSIAVDPSNSKIIYVATGEGLRISRDAGGTWQRAGSLGLGSSDIRHILLDDNQNPRIYAATGRGVFRYRAEADLWEELYRGMLFPGAQYLALSTGNEFRRKTLWAATKKGVYRAEVPDQKLEGASSESGTVSKHVNVTEMDVLSIFSQEPTIGEVRTAAIEYAEVQPEKILQWRKAAAARAWLPDLRVEYGKGRDWQSSTYFYSTSSEKYTNDDITKGKDDAWSISLNWELGDLIWNSAQTSIDTRSRLVVQLRDDVLSEVTRLYFERRRLMVEMRISPPEEIADRIENDLRLQELTAGLDALTGSYFSGKLSQGSGVGVRGSGK